jgi:hypothetical protein
MKRKIVFYSLIIISFAIASCNSKSPKEPTIDTAATIEEQLDDVDNSTMEETATVDDEMPAESEPAGDQTQDTPQKKTTKAKTSAPSVGGKETIYISTYGANGKVWGHVTMNGNRGRGTIHDDDENSYSITVTRHGGELHGTDQNGREYVFRM